MVASARTIRERLPGRGPVSCRDQKGTFQEGTANAEAPDRACLGVSEDQEQEERCRYSLLSKRWGLGRTAMEAPSRA